MRGHRPDRRGDGLATEVIAGMIGGLVASFAMEQFQRAVGKWVSDDAGGEPGGGGQQHRSPQSEPATYKAADLVSKATIGHKVPRQYKPAAGAAVHYAFGGSVGAIYGATAVRNPDVTAWGGVPFGAAVWLIADEMGMPLTGLSKPPTEYPLKDHASTFAAHLIFGATTEGVRRLIIRTLRH